MGQKQSYYLQWSMKLLLEAEASDPTTDVVCLYVWTTCEFSNEDENMMNKSGNCYNQVHESVCVCVCERSCWITVDRLKENFVLTDFCLKPEEETNSDDKESQK